MANVDFFDSGYRYTDPVRYFKANDPYYWEVDNIPVKQLEENANFLKDQVEGLLGRTANLQVDRSGFTELQPYVDGTNGVVKVKAGRYSARINDAYSIDPLQFLTQILGLSNLEVNNWSVKTNLDSTLNAVLQKFKTSLEADSLNMNGLAERAFTFPMLTNDIPADGLSTSEPGYPTVGPNSTPIYPNFTGQTWVRKSPFTDRTIFTFAEGNPSFGFTGANKAESDFIKRWRGVTRTAIVDVPSELEVTIPSFDENDHFYFSETGEKVLVTATQRIDLVFIYSKAVDQKSTTIPSYVGDNPTTLTEPTLGIVKGAGVGVSLEEGTIYAESGDTVSIQQTDGTPIMLGQVADENGDYTGLGSVKGSFPSPDDLMNLSPLLAENLETNNLALIGQSILPVAYVVVRNGQAGVIDVDDLIDIRPFFRTAELAYNERAGIAAATPQVSIANPVASEGYVDGTVRSVISDYTSKINTLNGSLNANSNSKPRIVGSGYVKGGFFFGVEAVLADFLRVNFNINDSAQAKQQVIARYGYPSNSIIPNQPDWDLSDWCKKGNYDSKGNYPNDRINFHTFGPSTSNNLPFAAFSEIGSEQQFGQGNRERINNLGTDQILGGGGALTQSNKGNSCIYYVKKRVLLDRTQIQWAGDYHVNVQLWNCAPLSCRSSRQDNDNLVAAGAASVWVDKKPGEFTIFVSWVAQDQFNEATQGGYGNEPGDANVYPHLARNVGEKFAGFTVINDDILNYAYANAVTLGESSAGVAIYPTVSFQVYGIPTSYSANAINLNNAEPLLVLE